MKKDSLHKIDKEIISLLAKRHAAAQEIPGDGVIEAELKSILRLNNNRLDDADLLNIYREILGADNGAETADKVSFLGPTATFSHQAVLKFFGEKAALVPCRTVPEVFRAVEDRRADFGVVPVENSTEGIVIHTFEMFTQSDLHIIDEIYLPVSHQLVSSARTLSSIKKIYSHPQPLLQCKYWIDAHLPDAKLIETSSTSEAARFIQSKKDSAAITNKTAAALYRLNILARNIEDNKTNVTRFLVIAASERRHPSSGNDRTSILINVNGSAKPGVLYRLLKPFAENNINMTRIESRPIKKRAWEYVFYIDFIGHEEDDKIRKTLAQMRRECDSIVVLGSYPVAADYDAISKPRAKAKHG